MGLSVEDRVNKERPPNISVEEIQTLEENSSTNLKSHSTWRGNQTQKESNGYENKYRSNNYKINS